MQNMRLLRRPAVTNRTGKTKSSIYADIADGSFPKPVQIGRRAVAWLESDIDDWIASRREARRGAGGSTAAGADEWQHAGALARRVVAGLEPGNAEASS